MKKTMKHIASLALVLAIMILPQVAFGANNTQQADGWSKNLQQNAGDSSLGIAKETPTEIIKNVINYALAIIGFLGVLGFIISGIMYLVSAGDEGAAEKAKGYMVNSIIGVVVALLGYVVMAAVTTLLVGSGSGL